MRLVGLRFTKVYETGFSNVLALEPSDAKRERLHTFAMVVDDLRREQRSIMRGHDLWLSQHQHEPRQTLPKPRLVTDATATTTNRVLRERPGTTRLQPITMLTRQAAGTIAALAVKQDVQPRALKPMQVQMALLESGSTLIQRWYADVLWGTEIWRSTQLLVLHQLMDRPGEIDRDKKGPLAANAKWGVDAEVSDEERNRVLERLPKLVGDKVTPDTNSRDVAILIARALIQSTQP